MHCQVPTGTSEKTRVKLQLFKHNFVEKTGEIVKKINKKIRKGERLYESLKNTFLEKNKNTKRYTRKLLDLPLYTEVHPGG